MTTRTYSITDKHADHTLAEVVSHVFRSGGRIIRVTKLLDRWIVSVEGDVEILDFFQEERVREIKDIV